MFIKIPILGATFSLAVMGGLAGSSTTTTPTTSQSQPPVHEAHDQGAPHSMQPRLLIGSRIDGVFKGKGKSEQLTFRFEVQTDFDKSADTAIAFHLTDNLGQSVLLPEQKVLARGMSKGMTKDTEFTTPDYLENGHYRLEAMVAGLSKGGSSESVVEERFFRVRGGQVEPLSFNDWFPTAHESDPVLDGNDPDPELQGRKRR